MQIALCQFNPTVGAVRENADRLLEYARQAHQKGAELIVAPELAICGYPPKDMLFRPELEGQILLALQDIAAHAPIPFLLGAPIGRGDQIGQPFWNAAVLCENKSWRIVAKKQLLPNYDVFDERRYFEPPFSPELRPLIELGSMKIGVTICEETWNDETFFEHRRYKNDPMLEAAQKGAQLLLNISASPFSVGKPRLREQLLAHIAKRHQIPVLMCGQAGANDQIIFDGSSLAIDKVGVTKGKLPPFEEGLLFVDIQDNGVLRTDSEASAEFDRFEWMRRALVCGISDYFQKCGVTGAIVGLSGGIDSAVCATLAVHALGAKNVVGVRMPSAYSSAHSLEDAELLAHNLGIQLLTFEIENQVNSIRKSLGPLSDVSDQNIQARVRGMMLMALSNESGKLVLATGNKSELSVGYCTLYGDMCGALAPLGDVFKTDIWPLARHLNQHKEIIPLRTIEKAPSAELRPDQTDQDTLPAYDALDAILRGYMEQAISIEAIRERTGLNPKLISDVIKMIHRSEYKRSQSPQILMLTDQVFGQGRRWPIAHRFIP